MSTVTSSLPLLGTGFQNGPSPSCGFPNTPRPHIPASHSNSSQQLNPSCYLTNSPTIQPTHCNVNFNVSFTLWLAVCRKSVRLGAKPLDDHDQTLVLFLFLQMNICGHSPYVTSSLTRGWICLYEYPWLLPRVGIERIASYGKFFLVPYIQVHSQSTLTATSNWPCLWHLCMERGQNTVTLLQCNCYRPHMLVYGAVT
jgi:hypothetical protein